MPDKNTQWSVIDDFSPGIFSNISPNHPDGAANPAGTFRCHAIHGNSLAPLPRLGQVIRGPFDQNPYPVTNTEHPTAENNLNGENRIVGLHATGAVYHPTLNSAGFEQNNTEVFITTERWTTDPGDFDNDTFYTYKLHRNWDNPEWTRVWTNTYLIEPYNPFKVPPTCDFATLRSNTADRASAGPVVTCWSVYGNLIEHPDNLNPGVDSTFNLPGDNGDPFLGGTLGALNITEHQGRLVIFPLLVLQKGANTQWVSNEAYFWTEVNNTHTAALTNYFNVSVGFDEPAGYQVIASLTFDELFLVRTNGGAAVIRGDLDNSSVVKYPYVRSAGYSLNRGVKTPKGYIYPVDSSSLWLWSGGQVSEQVTLQMADNFWRVPTVQASTGTQDGFLMYGTQCAEWGDLVMFPNNWVWDTAIDGPDGVPAMWRIQDPDEENGFTIHRWAADYRQVMCYGTPSGFSNADDPVLYEYDNRFLSPDWRWESHPISNTLNRDIELDEVEIVASGKGVITVRAFTSEDPVGGEAAFTVDGTPSRPFILRLPVGRVTGSQLAFDIRARADNPSDAAPTLHQLRYGWMEGAQISGG